MDASRAGTVVVMVGKGPDRVRAEMSGARAVAARGGVSHVGVWRTGRLEMPSLPEPLVRALEAEFLQALAEYAPYLCEAA